MSVKLRMENISKHFPGVKALTGVSFEADSGEIIGLVGVNGAGKSTLMNILGGIFLPDSGEIYIDGEKVTIFSPKEAERRGIAFIHQELVSFLTMTVAENIFISHLFTFKAFPLFISRRLINEKARGYLQMLGSSIKPTQRMEDISIGQRQEVEIVRAIAMGSDIVIFDEPTSSLSLTEKENLFKVVRRLKKEGKTIIYITHFLDEIMEICDKFVVLRNGEINGKGAIKDINKSDIIKMIIGKDIKYDKKEERKIVPKPVLKVENIKSGNLLKNIDFQLNKGEILGIWGLMGSGRTELIRAMLGLDRIDGGEIYISKNGGMKKISPRKLLSYCGYITESRHADGLFVELTIWKNTTATKLYDYSSRFFKFLNNKKEIEDSERFVNLLNISTPSSRNRVTSLSGGNQQKVVFSKWLNKEADILIMDEPTRGVDVGAKLDIHNLIRKYAEDGKSTILISSEIEEMIILSDRVLVLRDGSIVGNLSGKEISNPNLMKLSLGEVIG